MKLATPLIAAGLALAAFTTPASVQPANAADTGYTQLARNSKNSRHGRNTPPGWSKGNKTGWNGRNMPPGQWKKHQNDRNRWDRRDRNDRDRNDRDRNDRYRRDRDRNNGGTWDRDHSGTWDRNRRRS